MTIKKRLLLSHLTVFVVPIIMTGLVIFISGLFLIIFARNGNHIYVESTWEFQRFCEAIHYFVFKESEEKISANYWLIELLAPEQNFVLVKEGEKIIYCYGNNSLQNVGKNLLQESEQEKNFLEKDFTYISTLENDFVHIEKRVVNGKNYLLYFISERSLYDKDKILDEALKTATYFIIVSLIIFVLVISWLLSRFILKNILLPLKELETGAKKFVMAN